MTHIQSNVCDLAAARYFGRSKQHPQRWSIIEWKRFGTPRAIPQTLDGDPHSTVFGELWRSAITNPKVFDGRADLWDADQNSAVGSPVSARTPIAVPVAFLVNTMKLIPPRSLTAKNGAIKNKPDE
ncbi:MAG: hypothetical protein O2856_00170 [Planctomycetota bacterium]|nr:hypothetical protein [Planctomycetota bacterium]